jgi:hypothetical protein
LEQRKLKQQTPQGTPNAAGASGGGSASSTPGATTTPISSAKLVAGRTREREQAEKERIAAIHANRDLGLRLAKQLGSRKFDRPVAELLVQIVFAQNHELAIGGVAYTHEDFHELVSTRQKNGKTRTTFTQLDKHDAHQRALEWVLRPRSAEEVLGRLLQLLVAGVFADERAVAKSKRERWYAPAARTTEPMIAKLARKILPEHFHDRADRLLPKPEPKAPKPLTKKPASKGSNASKGD